MLFSDTGICAFAGAVGGVALGLLLAHLPKLLEDLIVPLRWTWAGELLRSDMTCPALYAFARFGIADVLDNGPKEGMTAQQLADEVGADGPSLYRVLRFLSMLDRAVVTLDVKTGLFRLARHGRLLMTANDPQNCKTIALFFCTRVFRHCRTALYDAVKTGKPGFKVAWGDQYATVWDVLEAQDKEAGATQGHIMDGPRIDVPCEVAQFDAHMTALSSPLVPLVALQPVWSRFKSIVDVGGASGATLKAILASPHGRGIERALVMDLSQVVEAQKPDPHVKAPSALSFVKGDFFQPLPQETMGVDAVLMKFILHDWSDAQCLQILRNVRPCLESRGGALVLVEQVAPVNLLGNLNPFSKLIAQNVVYVDMEMLSVGGRERTRAEWAELLGRAGFRLEEARLVIGAVHILVAHATG